MKKIESQKELDSLLSQLDDGCMLDCFVSFGMARSSKEINLDENGDYYVYNEIDDSEETIPHDSLDDNIIGEALQRHAFYAY